MKVAVTVYEAETPEGLPEWRAQLGNEPDGPLVGHGDTPAYALAVLSTAMGDFCKDGGVELVRTAKMQMEMPG